MTRDRASDLTILLALLGEAHGRGHGWVNHCPRCYGPTRYDGGLWKCGKGPGHPKGCGWYGEPETFTPSDAYRQAREAIDFLLAEIERLETPPAPAECTHCGAGANRACKRPAGPCLTKTT